MPDYKSSPLPPDASSTAPPPPPKPEAEKKPGFEKKKGHWWIWALVIAVLLIAGFVYYRHKSAADAAAAAKAAATPHAVPVVTATARKGSIGDYVEALGTVTPVFTVQVTARVQGQIMAVHYKEGQMVHKGDPLVDIDPRPYQAVLTQAQGQLAHDQALLSEANIDLTRYQQALDQKAIAEQQVYDQQQTVKQYQGTVENDQGTVAAAQVNLAYCHITSPIDGRVGLRLIDPGNVVQNGSTTPLVVVTQLQPITVIFNVAEDYLPQIQKGTAKGNHLTVQALDRTQESQIAAGTVTAVGNQIDTTTGTLDLRATFANTDMALSAGYREQRHAGSLRGRAAQRARRIPLRDRQSKSHRAQRHARHHRLRFDRSAGRQSWRSHRGQRLRQVAGRRHGHGHAAGQRQGRRQRRRWRQRKRQQRLQFQRPSASQWWGK
jgi:multidrug efflux system membrane fusion protein